MKAKFGAIITSGAGSLGGHTIQNSTGGMQLRTKPIPPKSCTLAQSSIRSLNLQLQTGWRSLTSTQQKVWNDYALFQNITNKNGDHHILSGHSLWMKYNFGYLNDNLPKITNPALYKAIRLGPELIINGDFTSSVGWNFQSSWQLLAGKAYYKKTANNNIYRVLSLSANLAVQLKFDISSASPLAYLNFLNHIASSLLKAPYNVSTFQPNGHYIWNCQISQLSNQFRIYGNMAGSTFYIDNVSLKQIL